MEFWVLTALALENKLEAAAEKCTEEADEASLSLCADTFSAFEKVVGINDKKRRIVNMKVLCDTIENSLDTREAELLKAYTRFSASVIAEHLGINRLKVYRDIKRACAKAEKALARIGFKKAEMERDYGDLALFARTYRRIKRLKGRERASSEPVEVGDGDKIFAADKQSVSTLFA